MRVALAFALGIAVGMGAVLPVMAQETTAYFFWRLHDYQAAGPLERFAYLTGLADAYFAAGFAPGVAERVGVCLIRMFGGKPFVEMVGVVDRMTRPSMESQPASGAFAAAVLDKCR